MSHLTDFTMQPQKVNDDGAPNAYPNRKGKSMNNLTVFEENGQLLTDSREVARMVEKDHSKLLRDIRNYCEHLTKSNFGLSDFFIETIIPYLL